MALAVVLAGGGTGGHIFPALALADAIRRREPDVRVHFVGTEHGLEVSHVRAAGYPLEFVTSRPLLGRGAGAALRALFTLLRGVFQARRILRRLHAQLVIGVGGYASVPTVAAAALARMPTALLEPNARPGRANRLLGRFSREIFVQFDEARGYFPRDRTHLLGYPVRTFKRTEAAAPDGALRLLVLGGSQGAHSINRAMCGLLGQLDAAESFRITHQTGARDYDDVKTAYAQAGVQAEIAAFFDDVLERLDAADLVVARAGAATIAELCATGTASILAPYPYAADDHQMANARELERAGASLVLPDGELSEKLAPAIRALAADPARRYRMAAAAAGRARPDAAERIWDRCRTLV